MRATLFALAAVTIVSISAPAAAGVYRLDSGKLPTMPTIPLTSDLKYYGGRVISNVKIVEVSWNSSVDAAYMTQLQGFYTAIVTSPFIDWMTEYDSIGLTGFADLQPGSNQHIGRGTFGGAYVITPSNMSTSLNDTDIQAELIAQLTSAALPAPSLDANGNVNSLYMFDFPAGVTITLVGLQSCSSFGAYHFTVKYMGMSVPYGVHPNCGYSFNTSTLIHSHELAEAITDTEVGLVEYNTTNLSARPLAWVTLADTAWDSLEAADICEGTSATVASYTVQKIWSNYAQACVAEIPICDGVLVPPACRPCNTFDSGNACTNACATGGSKAGQCVLCTSQYEVACTGATPVCDDPTYTCVGCEKNTDCTTMQLPVCDATSHMCRACAVDSECGGAGGGAEVCDVSNDSTKGECVACNNDSQCQSTQQCTAHACVALPMPEAGPEVGDQEMVAGASPGCGCVIASPSSPRATVVAMFVALFAVVRRRRKTP
jgi:MYXO-CTERM domain-containing protein